MDSIAHDLSPTGQAPVSPDSALDLLASARICDAIALERARAVALEAGKSDDLSR